MDEMESVRAHNRGVPSFANGKENTVLTEREMKILLLRINSGKIKSWDVPIPNDGYKLTAEHQKKGYDWLMSQWKSPTGKVRENNPFGGREEGILENFRELRLKGFYLGRGNWYAPLYEVAGDDTTMEYYVSGGKINIVG